jgi:hypothetical protein
MTTADQRVERAANKLQQLANDLAGEGGVKAKLAEPLAEDADFIRKLKPSLIKARAKGEAPTNQQPGKAPLSPIEQQPRKRPKRRRQVGGGPMPFIVVGAALVAGIVLAKWIDWRGPGRPTD